MLVFVLMPPPLRLPHCRALQRATRRPGGGEAGGEGSGSEGSGEGVEGEDEDEEDVQEVSCRVG